MGFSFFPTNTGMRLEISGFTQYFQKWVGIVVDALVKFRVDVQRLGAAARTPTSASPTARLGARVARTCRRSSGPPPDESFPSRYASHGTRWEAPRRGGRREHPDAPCAPSAGRADIEPIQRPGTGELFAGGPEGRILDTARARARQTAGVRADTSV